MVTKLTRFHGGVISSLVTRDHLCRSKRSEFVAIVSLCHVPSGHGWKRKEKNSREMMEKGWKEFLGTIFCWNIIYQLSCKESQKKKKSELNHLILRMRFSWFPSNFCSKDSPVQMGIFALGLMDISWPSFKWAKVRVNCNFQAQHRSTKYESSKEG